MTVLQPFFRQLIVETDLTKLEISSAESIGFYISDAVILLIVRLQGDKFPVRTVSSITVINYTRCYTVYSCNRGNVVALNESCLKKT